MRKDVELQSASWAAEEEGLLSVEAGAFHSFFSALQVCFLSACWGPGAVPGTRKGWPLAILAPGPSWNPRTGGILTLVYSWDMEKKKIFYTTIVRACSVRHWGATASSKQWSNMLNQTRDNHLSSMWRVGLRRRVCTHRKPCRGTLPGQPGPSVAGDGGWSARGEWAAGLGRDEGFPWQPLLARR